MKSCCRRSAVSLATWWILFCAFCVCAGWALSLLHLLNAAGYSAAFLLALGGIWFWSRKTGTPLLRVPTWARLRHRFSRVLPLSFLVLAGLVFLGGALYGPANWDALAYRVPRTLHWVGAGQWHWIHTPFERVNVRGCGFEWLMAPLIALTKTDRLFFLINLIPFCLFPGLFFSMLVLLGAKPRAAYAWMWLFPSGYCFLLQAGGLGNDFLGGFSALAAVAFGLKARREKRFQDFCLSLLAIALCTGVKANNLPLVLLWAVVVFPLWPVLRPHLLKLAAVLPVAAVISFVPTAFLNYKHLGDWTGTKADEMASFRLEHSAARILANTGVAVLQNFAPPLAPFAGKWNTRVAPHLATPQMNALFEEMGQDTRISPIFRMEELPIEESAGVGLGPSALLLISTVVALMRRRKSQSPRRNQTNYAVSGRAWIFAAILFVTAAFIGISLANGAEARLMNAYYPFLAALLLVVPEQAFVVRRGWWTVAALLVMIMAAIPLVLTPSRPLVPVQKVVAILRDRGHGGALAGRVERVYNAYSKRNEGLAPLLAFVPAGTTVIGYAGHDDLETGLWKPFGSRRIVHVCGDDTPEQLRSKGITFILIGTFGLARISPDGLEPWLKRMNADLVQTVPLALRGDNQPQNWYVVRLR
jgi:hypothetical protein